MMKVSAKTRYAARILLALARAQEKAASLSPFIESTDLEDSSLADNATIHNEGDTKACDTCVKPLPISSHVLAQETGVTVQFTEQILKALKRGGLTTSTRGAAGGHSLTRAPELISLDEVMRIMEGGIQLANCVTAKKTCSGDTTTCERADTCVMRHVWSHVTDALEGTLAKISLADLVKLKNDL